MTFKIEKGVPLTKQTNSRKGTTKYPFDAMQVGDSFSVPKKALRSVQQAAVYFHARSAGKRVSIRKHGKEYRAWRVI